MYSISSSVAAHWDLLSCTDTLIGTAPFLDFSIWNLSKILSMYTHWLRPMSLRDLSLYILIPKIYLVSPMSFTEKIIFNEFFVCSIKLISFYEHYVIDILNKKLHFAPTDLLVYTRFLHALNESKRFYLFIKALVPTPWCLLQPINDPLKLAYLLAIGCDLKTSRLYHMYILF